MKMRNLLEEFHANHGLRSPSILGVREHVFTGRFGIDIFEFDKQCDTIELSLFLSCFYIACLIPAAVFHRWPGSCQIKKLVL